MENIEKKLTKENKVLKKALELACEELLDVYCSDYCGNKNCEKCPYVVGRRIQDFIKLAQENLNEEGV